MSSVLPDYIKLGLLQRNRFRATMERRDIITFQDNIDCLGHDIQAEFFKIRKAMTATPHCTAGILAYNGTTPVRLGDKLWAIPISMLLQ
jgi:hypothetical protein